MLKTFNQSVGILLAACLALFTSGGCSSEQKDAKSLTLATTTSVQDSGLLAELLPKFREQTGIEVKVVAVGSGQAMEIGRRGDADVLITHSPSAEQKFMDEGYGSDRRALMHNDFVLVGPKDDPAGVRPEESIAKVFSRLASEESPFLSRGDDSGTHKKELEVWDTAGIEPSGSWYLRGGVGMAQALRMASEKQIYTLSDRGTFLALRGELDLEILSEGDPMLQNPYSVIVLNPKKLPSVNSEAATSFADFLTQPETRRTIGQFGVEKYGQSLFHPAE